jgi:hypothetical protein
MKKRSFHVSFKKDIIEYNSSQSNPYQAAKYFSRRDNFEYDVSMFWKWYKSKNKLVVADPQRKRSQGGGLNVKLTLRPNAGQMYWKLHNKTMN